MTTTKRTNGATRRSESKEQARKAFAKLAESWEARLDRMEAKMREINAIMAEKEAK